MRNERFLVHNALLVKHSTPEYINMNNYIESLNIGENVFVLANDIALEYLVHFAAPFTGSDCMVVPKGTCFALHGLMRDDAFYMHIVEEGTMLFKRIEAQVQDKYPKLLSRFDGVSFFITEEQLKTLPLVFKTGSRERALEISRLIIKRNEEVYRRFVEESNRLHESKLP